MIKKLFSYIFLIFFATNVTAEEIVMKCKFKKYKYITQDIDSIILTTKKKGEPKWVAWCPNEKTEDNKHWFVSAKNRKLIITDLKGVCMIEKGEFLMKNGNISFFRSITSVTDFKKLTYTSEFFWKNKKKKIKRKENCKEIEK
jgi:hypothetical protein|tara:strand:+ start:365 stop:793 length:429 start_codon:yes stop_codon:yes gene_type:complete